MKVQFTVNVADVQALLFKALREKYPDLEPESVSVESYNKVIFVLTEDQIDTEDFRHRIDHTLARL